MDETLKIRENLSDIRKNIGIACKKSGRDKDSIKLVVASKYADIVKMKKIYELGIREFGENRANDLLQKSEEMEKDITWHFIGHLQTNKIKKVIPIAEYTTLFNTGFFIKTTSIRDLFSNLDGILLADIQYPIINPHRK